MIACSLTAGQRVDPSAGATITVAAQRMVPQVVGQDKDAARQALLDAGAQNVVFALAVKVLVTISSTSSGNSSSQIDIFNCFLQILMNIFNMFICHRIIDHFPDFSSTDKFCLF